MICNGDMKKAERRMKLQIMTYNVQIPLTGWSKKVFDLGSGSARKNADVVVGNGIIL